MLSRHYVSIMKRIFYIDWQQHWECDWTMNIGANAHDERMVSLNQPQVTYLTTVGNWASSDIGEVLTWFSSHYTVSQCDCFTVWPFFAATYIFVVWNLPRSRFFGGALSSNVFGAVYWSLGHRGYFGVSNVVLVLFSGNSEQIFMKFSWYLGPQTSHQPIEW